MPADPSLNVSFISYMTLDNHYAFLSKPLCVHLQREIITPRGAVARIEEIIINAEHPARGGCSVVSGREHCNSIMHSLAPTSPPTFHLLFPAHPVLHSDGDFAVTLRLSDRPLL